MLQTLRTTSEKHHNSGPQEPLTWASQQMKTPLSRLPEAAQTQASRNHYFSEWCFTCQPLTQ